MLDAIRHILGSAARRVRIIPGLVSRVRIMPIGQHGPGLAAVR